MVEYAETTVGQVTVKTGEVIEARVREMLVFDEGKWIRDHEG